MVFVYYKVAACVKTYRCVVQNIPSLCWAHDALSASDITCTVHVNVFFERHYFSWQTFYVAIVLTVYLPYLRHSVCRVLSGSPELPQID
jgi:hypothetical protein